MKYLLVYKGSDIFPTIENSVL